jgi:osmoprotectant transport system permease protein
MLIEAWLYAVAHAAEWLGALEGHGRLVGVALGLGILLGVPSGIWTSRSRLVAAIVIPSLNAVRVVPSLAILFLTLPYLGLTFKASAFALTVLALPPILINTDAAFRNLPRDVVEAALAMGMTPAQLLRRVEIPLAFPVVMTGIRTAAVEVVASATLAAFIGGGGLGIYITRGLAMYSIPILLVGAIPVALLALGVDWGIAIFVRSKIQGGER